MRAALATSLTQEAFAQLEADATAALASVPSPPADFDVPAYYFDKAGHEAAKQVLIDDGGGALALALHAQLLPAGDPRVATEQAQAAAILDAWASTTTSVTNVDGPLVMAYKGIDLLLAADLLLGSAAWPTSHEQAFLAWVDTLFRPTVSLIATQPDSHFYPQGTDRVADLRALQDRVDDRVQRRPGGAPGGATRAAPAALAVPAGPHANGLCIYGERTERAEANLEETEVSLRVAR